MSQTHYKVTKQQKSEEFRLELLPQQEFDQLTELAALICQAPIAYITLVEGTNLRVKSHMGIRLDALGITDSLCGSLLDQSGQMVIVQDLRENNKLKDHPTVKGDPGLVFYLGVLLKSASGEIFGTLCIMDYLPRQLESIQLQSVEKLASQIVSLIEHGRDKFLLERARHDLQQEHLRLINIIEATEIGTWEWHIKTGEMVYSEGWAAMLGYSLKELGTITRKTRNILLHPDDLKTSEMRLHAYLKGKAPIYQCELRMKHKEGHWVWVLDRGQAMEWDEDGVPEVMFGTHTDITLQVTAKEQMATREKKFRALIENSDDAFAILDLKGKPTYVSASIERVLGYDEREAVELNLFHITHPDDREKVEEHFKNALKNPGIPISGHTARIRHKDGSWRWLSATITSMLHDPVINGIIDNFKDVTEEVISEQRLAQSERRFKKMVLEGADLITIIDLEARYLYMSPNYQVYLGDDYEKYLGNTAFGLIHADDLPRIQEEFKAILREKHLHISPYRYHHHIDGWRWVRSTATNLIDDPDIGGIVVNSVDITETIAIQNQLQVANERFEVVLQAGSESIYDYNPETQEIFLSQSFKDNLGIEIKSEKENFQTIYESLHPEDRDRAVKEFNTALEDPGKMVWEREYRLLTRDGQYAYIRDRSVRLTDGEGRTTRVVGAMRDQTREYIFQKLDEFEKELIERSLSEDADEKQIYADFLLHLESLIPNMRASVVKIIDDKLSNFTSPSLDSKFLFAIQGLPIGPDQGSCGTAAYQKERVLVQDVFTDSRWEKYRDMARKFGIGACWSFPILNSDGEVIATIANYFPEAKKSYGLELNVLERAHRIVGIVMAKFSYLEKIRRDNERYQIVNKSTNEAIFDWDVRRDRFAWGDSLRRAFGHDYSAKPFRLADWVELTHPEDRGAKDQEWADFLADPKQDAWANQFRLKRSNGTYAFVEEHAYMVRDYRGNPIRMVGVLRDRTTHYTSELLKIKEGKIAAHFRKDFPLEEILSQVLKELMGVGNWLSGEIWLSNKEASKVVIAAASGCWVEDSLYGLDPRPMSSLQDKEGLPAIVWDQKEVVFWNNLGEEDLFLRKEWIKNYNIISAVGIPFAYGDEILGIALLFGPETIFENSSRKTVFSELMNFIGAELRRKQIEEELKFFFNFSPDILAIASPRGYFTKVNPAFCQLLGYSEQELTEVPFVEYVHPDDLIPTNNEFDETSTADRLAKNFVNRYRTKSGDYRYISWSSSDVFGLSKEVFAYGRDVTEFKKMEELLQNATQLSRVGAWEVDLINHRTHWSRVTKEIHELDQEVNELDAAINFYREDYREMVDQKVNQAIKEGVSFDFEAVIVTAKGNERWVRAIGSADRVQGKTHRIFGSIQDIHQNKTIEQRLKSISDNVPGAIFQYVLKPDGSDSLIYVSKGSEMIWGLTPEECMEDSSRIWSMVSEGGDLPNLVNSIKHSAKTLDKWDYEWRILDKSGQVRWHHGIGIPVKKPDGTVIWDSLVMDVTERKHLEYLLEQSARMAKIGSWEIDARNEPYFLSWSSTTAEIVESTLDGVPLEDGFKVYAEEYQGQVRQGMYDLLREGKPFDQELLLTTGKGSLKWIRCLGQAQIFEGKVIRAFGSFQDIHDRKIADLELKRLLLERNDILESIGDGFFALDRNWIVNYWNHQAELLLQVPKQVILGKNLWEIFNQESDTLSYTNYHQAMETGEIVHFEEYYEKLETWFSISAFPSPAGLTVYFKDITAAKESEKLIRESNERFQKAAEATNDAIWDFQIESNKIYWGKGFKTLFGYEPEQAPQSVEVLLGLIHPEDQERVTKKLLAAQQDTQVQSWYDEYRFRKVNGEYAFVINRAIFIRSDKGLPVRIIGAITDLTERKKYEESLKILNQNLEKQAKELAISNSELEQFAYVASHDLQEPLRMVSSFLTQLERKYNSVLDEKAQQYIHFAVDGAIRMRKIILDLLEFSRVGKNKEKPEWILLPEMITEINNLHQKIIEETHAEILYEGVPGILGHRTPIFQILQNLIGNGLKYIRKEVSPKLLIQGIEEEDHWVISVKDNGIGIKKEYFEKIFIIFQRLHRKEDYQGTGMGLSIVKKIVEGQGGKIWLESEYGQGSTFYFTIPKAER